LKSAVLGAALAPAATTPVKADADWRRLSVPLSKIGKPASQLVVAFVFS